MIQDSWLQLLTRLIETHKVTAETIGDVLFNNVLGYNRKEYYDKFTFDSDGERIDFCVTEIGVLEKSIDDRGMNNKQVYEFLEWFGKKLLVIKTVVHQLINSKIQIQKLNVEGHISKLHKLTYAGKIELNFWYRLKNSLEKIKQLLDSLK